MPENECWSRLLLMQQRTWCLTPKCTRLAGLGVGDIVELNHHVAERRPALWYVVVDLGPPQWLELQGYLFTCRRMTGRRRVAADMVLSWRREGFLQYVGRLCVLPSVS